jgi:hypothetical protein
MSRSNATSLYLFGNKSQVTTCRALCLNKRGCLPQAFRRKVGIAHGHFNIFMPHILPGETPAELWRRALAPLGVRLLTETVARLANGEAPRMVPQDERLATFEPAFTVKRLAQE